MQSIVSGSKLVTNLNGKLYPGGSYSTYLEWLKVIGRDPLPCPTNDIVTFIDNIGRYIVKNYRVSYTQNNHPSIITTCLHITLDEESNLQKDASLKPSTWAQNITIEDIQNRMHQQIESSKSYFRQLRYNYISYMINEYKSDSAAVEKRIKDILDIQKRKCTNDQCGKVFDTCKRKCDACGYQVKKQERSVPATKQTSSSEEKYIRVGEKKGINLKDMKMGEPILVNPNSYSNIEHILQTLRENLEISKTRAWTFVGADGPPYCIASRLIERNVEKYDWVTMLPGLGLDFV